MSENNENQPNCIGIKKLPKWTEIADMIMKPPMIALWWFGKYGIQETHWWHIQNLSNSEISVIWDKWLDVKWKETLFKNQFLALFHMPIIWWRKNYIIIENKNYEEWKPRYIWWKHWKWGQIQRLTIYDQEIKMLVWPSDQQFFWLDESWKPITILEKAQWILWKWDEKYKNIRLF